MANVQKKFFLFLNIQGQTICLHDLVSCDLIPVTEVPKYKQKINVF
jgi:hypothetical protein